MAKTKIKKVYKVVEEEMYFGKRYYIKHIKLNKPVGYVDACPVNRQFHTIYYYSKARAEAECRALHKNLLYK